MKKFFELLAASMLVGLFVFVIWHWLIEESVQDSFNAAISAAGAGLVVEYLRPYLQKRKKNKIEER